MPERDYPLAIPSLYAIRYCEVIGDSIFGHIELTFEQGSEFDKIIHLLKQQVIRTSRRINKVMIISAKPQMVVTQNNKYKRVLYIEKIDSMESNDDNHVNQKGTETNERD